MMQPVVLGLGAATLGTAALHVFAGGKSCAQPMLVADFDRVARQTLHVCWHIVTLHLVLGGAALVWAGLSDSPAAVAVVRTISTAHLLYGVLFLAVAARSAVASPGDRPGAPSEQPMGRAMGWARLRPFVDLGQWIIFLPLGALGWLV